MSNRAEPEVPAQVGFQPGRCKEVAPEPNLISAIEAAVASDPGNSALRVHLGELLIEAGRPGDALNQAEAVLLGEPDHFEALGLAAKAGMVLKDARAPGWTLVHDSLGDDSEDRASSQPQQVPSGVVEGDLPVDESRWGSTTEDPWDRLLKEVLTDAGHPDVITLADVGGLSEVKERLEQSFLGPMRNPELRRAYGAHLRGGLLLWGPPGCGKTFLARAVAGELGARFAAVGLHQVLDMWLGNEKSNCMSCLSWPVGVPRACFSSMSWMRSAIHEWILAAVRLAMWWRNCWSSSTGWRTRMRASSS